MFYRELFLSSISTALLVLAIIATIIGYFTRNNHSLPHGPWGIPFLGYLPFLGKFPERKLNALRKKYGNIFSMYMGSKLAIVLGDYNSIHEAFVKSDSFNDRPEAASTKVDSEDKGLVSLNGESWKVHKRLVLRALRDHGLGIEDSESIIHKEILQFLDVLADFRGKPFNPHVPIITSLSNIMWYIQWGKPLNYFDSSFSQVCIDSFDYPKYLAGTSFRHLMPWTIFVPFINELATPKRLWSIKHNLTNFFKERIKKHEAVHVEGDLSHYIAIFLEERNKCIKKSMSTEFFTDDFLIDILIDFYAAGTNTMSITLSWLFLLLMTHPEIQIKLQTEIDEVVGSDRHPRINDRPYMPYTEAVFMEVQRWGSLAPLNVLHSNSNSATLKGFRIPEESLILCNLWAVHNDPDVWKDPEVFRPERFIVNGKLEVPACLIPFSIGKRACPGENFSKTEFFLYTTFVFQRYSVKLPANTSRISLKPIPHGLLLKPEPFTMQIKRRKT